MYLIQHYVIKFVGDLQQVSGFLRVLQFSSTDNTNRHDITEILVKVVLNITPPLIDGYKKLNFTQEITLFLLIFVREKTTQF